MRKLRPIERFLLKVRVDASSCWVWTGSKTAGGYGTFWTGSHADTAHRFAYTSFVSEISAGMQIDHLCRNESCVNPDHLEEVTPRENLLRGDTNAAKTHCKHGHPLSGDNLIKDRSKPGARVCRECNKRKCRERYARLGRLGESSRARG